MFPVVSINSADDTNSRAHVKVDHEARSRIFARRETSFCSYCYNRWLLSQTESLPRADCFYFTTYVHVAT